jgi:hypothetical protein
LNKQILSYLVPKDFEFAESFSKLAILYLSGFHKWRALGCRLFKREYVVRRKIYFASLQTAEIGPGQFSKAHSATAGNLLSKRSKVFEKLPANSKLLVLNG